MIGQLKERSLLVMQFAYLPPANEVNIFRSVCQEFCPRGGGGAGEWGCLVRRVLLPGFCSGGVWSRGVWSRGVCSGGEGAWWRPPRTATAAGGTHPTGMHSCLSNIVEDQHYHPSTHDLRGHFQSEDTGPPDPVYFVDRSFVCVSQFPY